MQRYTNIKLIKKSVWLLALVSALSFAACGDDDTPGGGSDDTDDTTDTSDTTAPTLEANPPPGMFSATTTVTLTASEEATVYYTTTGTDPSETSANGASPLQIDIALTTTIRAYAEDAAGNQSAIESFEYLFDDTAPFVESNYPQDADDDIGTFANIILSFSEAMDRTSVEAALSLTPTTGGDVIPLSFHWYTQNNKDVLVAWPANLTDSLDVNTPFEDAIGYDLVLGADAKDLAYNALATEFSFAFTTLANANPIVTAISPDPGNLVNQNTAEVSITFDRPMDKLQGRLEIEGQLFDDKVELTIDDTDLNWNAAGTQLILTVGEPDPNQESVILRFKDLYKANGDKAPDVDVSYIFNRSDAPDSLAPVIDLPHLAGTEPLSFDPTLPYIWFSESVDPATLNHITATNVATSATIDLGVEPGFQRSAFISTAEMQPGEEYEITVGTSLLDAAATAIESENTFTIQIPADYDFGTPTIFGLSDGETDMPIRDLDLYVEFPGGFEPTSISNEDVKLYATTTGEPVRGMHIEVPNTFEGVTGLKISMSAGMRALRTNTEYTLELSGITATGGHEYFSSAPLAFSFTTVDSGSTGMPENARPLFDLEDTSISVSAGDSGPTAEATALILDDDGSFTVSLSGVGYEFSAELEVDADDPMRFELPEGTLIEDSAFTTGWNDMELSINDGTHTVSVILAVYFMPTEEIPEITSPTMSAVLDPADISTLTFDWTHVTGDPALQILVLANMDQGEMSFLDWAFLDPAVDSFPAGERFARHLQPGHNYGLFVIKLVTRFGFQGAGSAMIMGESVIIFSILDPTLGSISGSINLLAPIATAPVILAAHTADDLANGLFVASAYAVEGTDELTWDYFMPNLDDGDYYLTVWVDVLGNDVESDQTTHEDNVGAVYHEGNLIDPATIASAADLTSIDIDLLNWPGRIDVSITSDHAIEGKIQIILCPTGLGRPDASCQWKSNREMNGAQNYDQTLYNIEDGDYEVWAHYDVDGDETLDLLSIGDPAPVTISADTQDVLFDLVIPQGSVSGAITLNMSMPGAKVMAFVFAEGESFDDTVQHFVIAENPSGDGINFSYTVPYIENGTHDIYVAVDYDSDDDADAIGDPWPATVSITGNDATQDFTVDIPVGDLSGTTTSITGTISDEVWVVAYYRGADRATDEPIFVVLATDSGDQKEFSWALNDMPQADYDLYTDLDSDIDGVFDPDAGSATCIAAQVNVPDFSGTPVIMGFLDI